VAATVHVAGKHTRSSRKLTKITVPAVRTAPRTVAKLQKINLASPLRGSHESLLRQNQIADQEGLERIADSNDLAIKVQNKELVALPVSNGLLVNPSMEPGRRYCRRWTAKFLTDLAVIHAQRFHGPLQVTSAVRTVEMQRALLKVNGNAAPAEGDVASPHLTGAAVDIAKKGLSMSEIAWMRAWLLPLQQAGKIDVEEEFVQSCFHISVYKDYLIPMPANKAVPVTNNLSAQNLSAKAVPSVPPPSPKRVVAKTQTAKLVKKIPSRPMRVHSHHRASEATLARRSGGTSSRRMG
jgi:uncharacterized protein YcbK (DUF882 family)